MTRELDKLLLFRFYKIIYTSTGGRIVAFICAAKSTITKLNRHFIFCWIFHAGDKLQMMA